MRKYSGTTTLKDNPHECHSCTCGQIEIRCIGDLNTLRIAPIDYVILWNDRPFLVKLHPRQSTVTPL